MNDPRSSTSDSINLQFQSQPASSPIVPTAAKSAAGTRTYRPRNSRSCDFCRARKSACKVEGAPPCATCQTFGRECTFADRPRKRKRSDHGYSAGGHLPTSPQPVFSPENKTSPRIAGSVSSQLTGESPTADDARIPEVRRRNVPNNDSVPSAWDNESIDAYSTRTTFLLGDTGESDPYLLQRYCYDGNDYSAASRIGYRHIRRQTDSTGHSGLDNSRPLVFMLQDHNLYDKSEPRVEDSTLESARKEVESMCSDEIAVRLVKLHFRFVYPYFPIMSRSQTLSSGSSLSETIRSLPLSLRAALCASGVPFLVYDDVLATTLVHSPPSTQELFRISWLAITHEVHTPHLSTLQSCLLLLQRVNDDRYVMDTAFRWSVLAWTVSLAQTLGLSTDCTTWLGFPSWERRLRRRLWWAVYVVDKWSFMSAGLPSHIKNEDFDVLPLRSTDFFSSEEDQNSNSEPDRTGTAPVASHFYHLVELSIILSDTIESYFTMRAASRTARNFSLSLELAKPLRSSLKQWKVSYDAYLTSPQNSNRPRAILDGNASLGLAYPVANMILFRALLRPLEHFSDTTDEGPRMDGGQEAVRAGAKACCIEIVDYVEHLQRGVWDAFWHSWSRAMFAIASSFMMRILVTSTSPTEAEEVNNLIIRWRWAMRTGGGSAGNVLMSLGLLRLDRSLWKTGIRASSDEED